MHSVIVPFIAEQIAKDCMAVVFPDGSGDVYLFSQIPLVVQRKESREEYFKQNGVQPAFRFSVREDGMCETDYFNTSAQAIKAAAKLSKTILSRFGLPYLISCGFVRKELALSLAATAIFLGESAVDPAYSPDRAVESVVNAYNAAGRKARDEMRNQFGLSEQPQAPKLAAVPEIINSSNKPPKSA